MVHEKHEAETEFVKWVAHASVQPADFERWLAEAASLRSRGMLCNESGAAWLHSASRRDLLYACAILAAAVYAPFDDHGKKYVECVARRVFPPGTFQKASFFGRRLSQGHGTAGEAMFVECSGFAVLSWRGTDSLRDWLTNLHIGVRYLEKGKDLSLPEKKKHAGCVHRGFYNYVDRLWDEHHVFGAIDDFFERQGPEAKLIVTGHSLGGSAAMITALRVTQNEKWGQERIAFIGTFGQPRSVASKSLMKYIACVFQNRYVRVANMHDPVPQLPCGRFNTAAVEASCALLLPITIPIAGLWFVMKHTVGRVMGNELSAWTKRNYAFEHSGEEILCDEHMDPVHPEMIHQAGSEALDMNFICMKGCEDAMKSMDVAPGDSLEGAPGTTVGSTVSPAAETAQGADLMISSDVSNSGFVAKTSISSSWTNKGLSGSTISNEEGHPPGEDHTSELAHGTEETSASVSCALAVNLKEPDTQHASSGHHHHRKHFHHGKHGLGRHGRKRELDVEHPTPVQSHRVGRYVENVLSYIEKSHDEGPLSEQDRKLECSVPADMEGALPSTNVASA